MKNRRGPVALLLLLLAAGLSTGAVGMASASDGVGRFTKDSFEFTEPARGERGLYTATVAGAWSGPNGSAPFPFLEYAWGDDVVVYGADGKPFVANQLITNTMYYAEAFGDSPAHWVPVKDTLFVNPHGGIRHWQYEGSASWSHDGDSLIGRNDARTVRVQDRIIDPFGPEHPGVSHCVLLPSRGPQDCTFNGLTPSYFGFGSRLRAPDAAWVEKDDVYGKVYRTITIGTPSFEAAYAAGISTPVRFSLEWPQSESTDYRVLHANLTGYQPGFGDRSVVASTALQPLGEPAMAPVTWTGPSEAGIDGFTAAEALESAASWEPFATWHAAHPAAFVYEAELRRWSDNFEGRLAWDIHLTDGVDTFSLVVERPESGLMIGISDADRYDLRDPKYAPHIPTPGSIPEAMISVASAMTRAPAYLQRDTPVYRFSVGCDPHYTALGDLVVLDERESCGTVAVGDSSDSLDYVAFYTTGSFVKSQAHSVVFDQHGHALMTRAANFDWTAGYHAFDALPSPETQESKDVELGASMGAWASPTAAEAVGIGLFALLLSAIYYFWPGLKTLPVFGLFSRVTGPRLARHPARRRILDLVDEEPGIHFQELVRRAELANGQARHHLQKLEEGGMITVSRGSKTCFFPQGKYDHRVVAAAPTLRSEGARAVLAAVSENPGLNAGRVATLTGLSPGTVSHHLNRLRQAELVYSERCGKGIMLAVTEGGRIVVKAGLA